ncbi:hypothetical protein EV426DRAFT_619257 [Tirmania nivea]|nr:hypothetical protein EV426DRAFT_619257 [Tirmania nivea]
MNTKEMIFHVHMHSLLSYILTTHFLLYFCRNSVQSKPGEIPILLISILLYLALMYCQHPLILNLTQTRTQKQKNSHVMLLALASLGDGLRKNDIGVVRLASVLLEHKNTSALHAVSLGITHAHVGLLIIKFFVSLFLLCS